MLGTLQLIQFTIGQFSDSKDILTITWMPTKFIQPFNWTKKCLNFHFALFRAWQLLGFLRYGTELWIIWSIKL